MVSTHVNLRHLGGRKDLQESEIEDRFEDPLNEFSLFGLYRESK